MNSCLLEWPLPLCTELYSQRLFYCWEFTVLEQLKFSIFQKGCDMEKCELDVGKLTLTVCVAFMLEDIQLVV